MPQYGDDAGLRVDEHAVTGTAEERKDVSRSVQQLVLSFVQCIRASIVAGLKLRMIVIGQGTQRLVAMGKSMLEQFRVETVGAQTSQKNG
jgi:hypothetical protein